MSTGSLRQQIQRERDVASEQAAEHGEMSGSQHWAAEERAYGRVEAFDIVLAMLDEAEQREVAR